MAAPSSRCWRLLGDAALDDTSLGDSLCRSAALKKLSLRLISMDVLGAATPNGLNGLDVTGGLAGRTTSSGPSSSNIAAAMPPGFVETVSAPSSLRSMSLLSLLVAVFCFCPYVAAGGRWRRAFKAAGAGCSSSLLCTLSYSSSSEPNFVSLMRIKRSARVVCFW
ncbi:hypothetical protein GGF47_001644 [Coemansia sp. RSA 2524]|nr:hypothetical protein GGF47_001644 [Coemansia sp. RSA 2524]